MYATMNQSPPSKSIVFVVIAAIHIILTLSMVESETPTRIRQIEQEIEIVSDKLSNPNTGDVEFRANEKRLKELQKEYDSLIKY